MKRYKDVGNRKVLIGKIRYSVSIYRSIVLKAVNYFEVNWHISSVAAIILARIAYGALNSIAAIDGLFELTTIYSIEFTTHPAINL